MLLAPFFQASLPGKTASNISRTVHSPREHLADLLAATARGDPAPLLV
jgi:hypothetical protein